MKKEYMCLPKDLIKVAAHSSRIRERQADRLLRVDDKHRANLAITTRSSVYCSYISNMVLIYESEEREKGKRLYRERLALGVNIRRILLVQHVEQKRYLPVLIGNLTQQQKNDSVLIIVALLLNSMNLGSDLIPSLTIGNWTSVGPAVLAPNALISSTHFLWSLRPFAEMPISFTPRWAKSGARRATSPSSVVHTGVKSAGWEKRMAWGVL
jgi:hypothetical protein